MRTITATVVTMAAAVALLLPAGSAWAGGGGHGNAACQTTSSGQLLAMLDSCFDGIVHTVTGGSTLDVTNRGDLPHTITASDGSFDSGTVQPGETVQIDLEETGEIPVYCTLHGTADGTGMAGLLQVPGSDVAEASLASTSTGPAGPAREAIAALVGAVIGAIAHRHWTRRTSS